MLIHGQRIKTMETRQILLTSVLYIFMLQTRASTSTQI